MIAAILALVSLGPQSPALVEIEGRSGAEISYTRDISADGTTVVGESTAGAFRWTAAGGFQPLFREKTYAAAISVSRDGTVIVGTRVIKAGETRSFRWIKGKVDEPYKVNMAEAFPIEALVSDDGKTMLISQPTKGRSEASHFLLSAGGKKVKLQAPAKKTGDSEEPWLLSGDGRFAIGNIPIGDSYKYNIYRWDSTGHRTKISSTGTGKTVLTLARAASSDGSIIAGDAKTMSGDYGVLWRGGKTTPIYSPSESGYDSIFCMAGDGSVVGGYIDKKGFIWSAKSGVVSAARVLRNAGLSLPASSEITCVRELARNGDTLYLVLTVRTPEAIALYHWARVPVSALR